jgi:hypothetical protein
MGMSARWLLERDYSYLMVLGGFYWGVRRPEAKKPEYIYRSSEVRECAACKRLIIVAQMYGSDDYNTEYKPELRDKRPATPRPLPCALRPGICDLHYSFQPQLRYLRTH